MPIGDGFPSYYHVEFGAWLRLEPRARSNDLAQGIAARVADPLWMLARQWQTGEFDGEDAGSPISALLRHSTQPLDWLRMGAGPSLPLPAMPLETAVERERVPFDWRMRVAIGQQFERFARTELRAAPAALRALLDAYRADFGVVLPSDEDWEKTDRDTRRFLRFMAGRVIDGGELLAAIELGALQPPAGVSAAQLASVVGRLTDWLGMLVVQPGDDDGRAWRSQQLDHRFELTPSANGAPSTPPDRIHLVAPAYRNGNLDWHSFSAVSDVQGTWTAGDDATVIPTRISVGGTSRRWWTFEDAATDFGALDVATPDLAKLLLMEFVLIYGDDWFSVPISVKMPRLVRVDELRVTNVFGEPVTIAPVRTAMRDAIRDAGGDPDNARLRWEMFTLSRYPAEDPDRPGLGRTNGGEPSEDTHGDVLLIPPVSGWREESEPLEEIRFLRDEGANSVWGVEHLIANGIGRPVDGFDAQRNRLRLPVDDAIAAAQAALSARENALAAANGATDAERAALRAALRAAREALDALRAGPSQFTQGALPAYRLATPVPANWIPFLPVSATPFFQLPNGSIRLRRAQMLRNMADEEPLPIPAMSRLLSLLADDPLLWLEEAAVLRSGVRVQLTAQRTRWTDGKTYIWYGRKVLLGRGEGASGLRFDVIPIGRGRV